MKKIIIYLSIGLLVLLAMPILYAYLAYPAEYVNHRASPHQTTLNHSQERVRLIFSNSLPQS